MPIDWREEDLLFAILPNGDVIDIGWYPACDPAGFFKVTLSDAAQNQINSIRVFDLDQAVAAAESLALDSAQKSNRNASLSFEHKMLKSTHDSTRTASCTATVFRSIVVTVPPPKPKAVA